MWPPQQKIGPRRLNLRKPLWLSWLATFHIHGVYIRWGTEMSSYFNISNGVRQGGILILSLFAIYMDPLSSLLNTSRIGCHISDVCINHVFYANDV